MTKRSSWALPYFIFLVFFVVLPLLLVLVYALQDGSGKSSAVASVLISAFIHIGIMKSTMVTALRLYSLLDRIHAAG